MIHKQMLSNIIIYDISSGDRYDVTLEDEVSGSVLVYWDVLILFLHTTELIRDFIVKERNWNYI